MMMEDGRLPLPPKGHQLTEAQRQRVDELQAEIDEIWSRKGNYKIDDEAWKTMPLFMNEVTEQDVETNEACAALNSIIHDEIPPEETAQKMKESGNAAIQRALTIDQVNPDNHARAAVKFYSDGIAVECNDRVLNAQLYANRSMAQYLLQNYGHGLADAQRAILMNPAYTKAYYRAAKCAEKVQKFDVARSLVAKGLSILEQEMKEESSGGRAKNQQPTKSAAQDELLQLQHLIEQSYEAAQAAATKKRLVAQSNAVQTANIIRDIQAKGIVVSPNYEMQSDQWSQLNQQRPYFDGTGILHVPLLILYDEFSTSDFLQDMACDCTLRDAAREVMPFPFAQGDPRYAKTDTLVVFFKIDDGVSLPKYYVVDWDWQLLEVMRMKGYVMPGMVPTFHIIPADSPYARQIGIV